MKSNKPTSFDILRKALFGIALALLAYINPTFAITYYIDSYAGNDLNSGLSKDAPWQTLAKVNAYLFLPNDSILFKRNGVWRGQMIPKSGSTLGNITYSDYGTGEKPLLLGSVNKSLTSNWINEGRNIWRCSTTFPTDIGNLIFNNASSFGIKKWTQTDLVTQGDYWYDLASGQLKIFSTANPGSFYSEIECAQRNHIVNFEGVSYAVFNNLSLKYGAAHGFGGGNTNHLIIRACDISFIGGGDLDQDGSKIRFGNGIEFWGNANNNIVEQCKIWEIYDTGLSNQNHTNSVKQFNIRYQNNIIYNCSLASFEYWNKPPSSTTANIRFENNTCVNAGYGWGTQRPDRKGVHVLLSYNEANTDSIFIRNNIFYNANASLALPTDWNTTNGYKKLKLSNNCYFQPLPTDTFVFLFFSSAFNATTFSAFQSNTGLDIGSFISDPLFVNYSENDFHLTPASPVINQGYPTSLLNDFDNEPRTHLIDIGADEYHKNTSAINVQAEKHSFYITPNPANEMITVRSSSKNYMGHIQIYNATGILLKEFEMKESTQINIEDLPNGLYFINLTNHHQKPIKLIKQNKKP